MASYTTNGLDLDKKIATCGHAVQEPEFHLRSLRQQKLAFQIGMVEELVTEACPYPSTINTTRSISCAILQRFMYQSSQLNAACRLWFPLIRYNASLKANMGSSLTPSPSPRGIGDIGKAASLDCLARI
jgi:hypothetical protein